MPDWRVLLLSEVVRLKRGYDLPISVRGNGPYPVVGSAGINGWHDEGPVDGPGVAIGRSGASIGVATYVSRPFWPLNTVLFAEDFCGNDPRFVYYLLRTLDFIGYNSGSAQPSLNRNYIGNIQVSIPTAPEQRSIGRLLGSLDDKIAVNDRIVQASDELRQLRFQEFMLTRVDSVVDRPLSSIADFINGRAFTKDASGTGRMVVRIAELSSGPGGSTTYNDIEVPAQHLALPGDVLFSWSGSLMVVRWFRPEAIVNQHIFKVVPHEGIPDWLAFELIAGKLETFRRIAAGKATTMGHIQRHHLDEVVSMPNEAAIPELDAQLCPLWDRALAAEQESLTLVRLRDRLLPGLMSGEVRVRDAERAVEEAT